MPPADDPRALLDLPALDRDGGALGTIEGVLETSPGGPPELVLVRLVGGDQDIGVAVPYQGEEATPGGVRLGYPREAIAAAPPVDLNATSFSSQEREIVHAHFRSYGTEPATRPLPGGPAPARPLTPAPGTAQEAEVTVSEEQLVVDRVTRPYTNVRVRKEVVTDEVTITVQLQREQIVIEEIPISPGSAEAPGDYRLGPSITEIVLYAEEPVVDKRVVPVQRVRVAKEVVTDMQEVSAQVQREHVEVDSDDLTAPTRPLPHMKEQPDGR